MVEEEEEEEDLGADASIDLQGLRNIFRDLGYNPTEWQLHDLMMRVRKTGGGERKAGLPRLRDQKMAYSNNSETPDKNKKRRFISRTTRTDASLRKVLRGQTDLLGASCLRFKTKNFLKGE